MRLLLSLSLLLAICPPAFAGDVLTARFNDDLSVVKVELCFDGAAAKQLHRNSWSENWSEGIHNNNQAIKIRENNGTVRLPSLADNSCLNWQVDLQAASASGGGRTIARIGGDLIMNADVWFWQGSGKRDLRVHILLPDGISFSTPWKLLNRENGISIYRPDNTPPSWEAKIVLGRFNIENVDIPAASLTLAMPGDLSDIQRHTLTAWIEEAASSVSLVSGSFPQPNVQVVIIPAGNQGRYGTFGQVLRGGGFAVVFYVGENSSLQELRSGWTATHEFSHLLLPYISSRDRWLSEGMASYYQNVLRARDERISATDAWQGLYDGFERGRKATAGGTLAQATRAGRASTMRVYWSGAAIMLMADVQLRQLSGGQQSLDSALASLAECCLSNGETWRANQMFAKLDMLTGGRVFSDLYQKYVNSENFPDLQETWNVLGIHINDSQVVLKEEAPLVTVRNSIMKD